MSEPSQETTDEPREAKPFTRPFQFSISVRDLKEAVTELRKLAPRNPTLPIIATALVERDKGVTRLTEIAKLPWTFYVSAATYEGKGHEAFKVTAGRWTLESRTIEGNYPNWRQVVPQKDEKGVAICKINTYNRLQASDMLKRLPKNSAEKSPYVKVAVGAGDVLKFSKGSNSFEVILSGGVGNKPRHTCGALAFWQRLVDLGCTEIYIKDELSPIVGYRNGSSNLSYVFMPMRLVDPGQP